MHKQRPCFIKLVMKCCRKCSRFLSSIRVESRYEEPSKTQRGDSGLRQIMTFLNCFTVARKNTKKDQASPEKPELILWSNAGKWKERYFAFQHNCLLLFKNADFKSPDFALDVRGCSLEIPVENTDQGFLSFKVRIFCHLYLYVIPAITVHLTHYNVFK